jgi:hypothetical protein
MLREFLCATITKRQLVSHCLNHIDRRSWHPQSPDWTVRVFLLIPALLAKPTRPLEVQIYTGRDLGLLPFRTVCTVPQLAAAGATWLVEHSNDPWPHCAMN